MNIRQPKIRSPTGYFFMSMDDPYAPVHQAQVVVWAAKLPTRLTISVIKNLYLGEFVSSSM